MRKPIYFFSESDPYFELSNFSPHGFAVDGAHWPTVEHYFQAQKFEDAAYRERIRNAASPQRAKALGQSRAQPIRQGWDAQRDEVMLHALRCKFADPELQVLLLSTGLRTLIENSPHDSYWGCGRDGKGENRLGVILMRVREDLR